MINDSPIDDELQDDEPLDGESLDDEPLPLPVAAAEPVEPEQIGALIFLPNAEYPYPFKVATPPRFWMEETTGALNDAVEAYMNGDRLSPQQLDLIKLYLRQFIERAVLTGEANRKLLLGKIDRLKTTGDVERFADEVSEYGGEVF